MTTSTPAPDDLGVVDPIRLPPALGRMRRSFNALPLVARIFGVLAIVAAIDVLITRFGFLGSESHPDSLVAVTAGLLPGILLIAAPIGLPVAVWMRRPDFVRTAPLVAKGAIGIASGALLDALSLHLNNVISALAGGGLNGGSPEAMSAVGLLLVAGIRLTSTLLTSFGLIWLARGLLGLEVGTPGPTVRRIASIAGGIIAGAAIAAFVLGLSQLPTQLSSFVELGLDRAYVLTALANLAGGLSILAWAYLAWVLIRASAAGRGGRVARRLGALAGGAAGLSAFFTIASMAAFVWLTSQTTSEQASFEALIGWQGALSTVGIAAGWLSALAWVLLFAAFALGLHDGPRLQNRTADPQPEPAT